MKYFFRIVIANMIAGAIGSLFLTKTYTVTLEFSSMTFSDWLFAIWAIFTMISVLFWLAYMFYCWGVTEFQKRRYKTIWFFVFLVGFIFYFLGPLIFYVTVYELKMGVKEKLSA